MKAVKLTQMVEEMNLKNLTPNVDMKESAFLHFSGYQSACFAAYGCFERFASERVQIIGYVNIPCNTSGEGKKTQLF